MSATFTVPRCTAAGSRRRARAHTPGVRPLDDGPCERHPGWRGRSTGGLTGGRSFGLRGRFASITRWGSSARVDVRLWTHFQNRGPGRSRRIIARAMWGCMLHDREHHLVARLEGAWPSLGPLRLMPSRYEPEVIHDGELIRVFRGEKPRRGCRGRLRTFSVATVETVVQAAMDVRIFVAVGMRHPRSIYPPPGALLAPARAIVEIDEGFLPFTSRERYREGRLLIRSTSYGIPSRKGARLRSGL